MTNFQEICKLIFTFLQLPTSDTIIHGEHLIDLLSFKSILIQSELSHLDKKTARDIRALRYIPPSVRFLSTCSCSFHTSPFSLPNSSCLSSRLFCFL